MEQSQASKKQRYEDKDAEMRKEMSTHSTVRKETLQELFKEISAGAITKEMLREKLLQHVQQVRRCLSDLISLSL